MAWAARNTRPSSSTASQVAQPEPAAPMRAEAGTATLSSCTWYWQSEAMENIWVRVTPSAFGSTRNRSMSVGPVPVRASTTRWVAAAANGTCHLVPVRRNPSPSARASTCTPLGPKPLFGSSQAVVAMAVPLAISGRRSCFWSSVPARRSSPALSTALTKWGDGARARPSSS